MSERGHARHGAEGSSRKHKSSVDAQVEQARVVDVADPTCERDALEHPGVQLGARERGVGGRRVARVALGISPC